MTGGIKSIVASSWQCFLDCLFPKHCFGCGREQTYFCDRCRELPIKAWDGQIEISGEKYFDKILCVGDYDDPILGEMIRSCKYRFAKDIAKDLAHMLAQKLNQEDISAELVAVPLSKRRQRWRGFNQAEEIASGVALELKVNQRFCLKRIKHTKAQAKLSEEERADNMAGAFVVCGELPQRVILIDDVITTGTTINECARVLKEAGAENVTVAALAKG